MPQVRALRQHDGVQLREAYLVLTKLRQLTSDNRIRRLPNLAWLADTMNSRITSGTDAA